MTRHDGDLITTQQGQLTWWAAQPAPVAAGVISPVPGVTVSVDLTDPRRVVAWTVPSPDALQALSGLFGQTWLDTVRASLTDAPGLRTAAASAPPPLPEAWARLALAAGVQRWLPAPVPEAALCIDWALACHAVGLAEQARTEFATASASLLQRAEQCLDGDLPPAMRPGLHAATHTAAQLLGNEHPDAAELADRAADLKEAADRQATVIHAAASAVGQDFLTALTGAALAVHAGLTVPDVPEALTTAWVDPTLVPARILRWEGAENPELLVESYPDRLLISATLAEDTDPEDKEVTELLARVLDPATGTVCGSGAFTGLEDLLGQDGHKIVAEVPLLAPAPELPTVQVYQAGRPHHVLDTIRGPQLIRVDRLLLEAWTLHRLALAAHALGDAAADTLLQEAADRAQWAATALDERIDTPTTDDTGLPGLVADDRTPLPAGLRLTAGRPTSADLRARLHAIRRYRTVLVAGLEATGDHLAVQVTQPLLAELELLAVAGSG